MNNPNWSWRPLGELFAIGAGKTMSEAARTGANKVPFLRTSNVFWDEIDLTELDEMSMSTDELAGKSLRSGDLLVCEGGDIGRAAVWNGEREVMSFQNHLHRLRPIVPDIEPRFYVYFLQSGFTQLGIFEGAGNKTTIPNLSRNRLAALEVPVPSVVEQRAIVYALARTREATKAHDLSLNFAEDLKRAAMRELFTRGLRGEPMKQAEFGQVPESWRVDKLELFAQFQRGFDITKAEQSEGAVPVVSSGGIRSFHDRAAASGPGVLIGRKGSIGSLYFVETDFWPHDTTLWCRDFRGNNPKFVFYRLHLMDFKRLDSGATNPALNRNFLHEELIAWPEDLREQESIVSVLASIDRKIELHRQKRDLIEHLFKTLLHKLMTGEIRAADLDLSDLPQEKERVAA